MGACDLGFLLKLEGRSMHPGGLRLTARAAKLAGISPGMTVADIGCGLGATVDFLARRFEVRAEGLDVSGELVEEGRRVHPGARLNCWDCGGGLPFEDGRLDAFFLECSLSAIGRAEKVASECARALKLEGTIVVSDLERKLGKENQPEVAPGWIEKVLSGAGFDVAASEDHTPALMAFAAELFEAGIPAQGCLALCAHGPAGVMRLSDFGYRLVVGRKREGG